MELGKGGLGADKLGSNWVKQGKRANRIHKQAKRIKHKMASEILC